MITALHVRNFRCFGAVTVSLDAPITIIQGINGSGKTSLAEALYYACYLRSFRTSHARELVHGDNDHFAIQLAGIDNTQVPWRISIGYHDGKRKVRINDTVVQSYKELLNAYRVVTGTADDVQLIAGGPEQRRLFMDQAVLLVEPTFGQTMRTYRRALQQRNAVLAYGAFNADTYALWTEQLWETARVIIDKRMQLLARIESHMNQLCIDYISPDVSVTLSYTEKNHALGSDRNAFFHYVHTSIKNSERRYRRTLWGPHLHDCTILFKKKQSRIYASRGQQKLLALLLKLALLKEISDPVLVVLDDFITDFDEEVTKRIITMLTNMPHQLVITTPRTHNTITHTLASDQYRIFPLDGK